MSRECSEKLPISDDTFRIPQGYLRIKQRRKSTDEPVKKKLKSDHADEEAHSETTNYPTMQQFSYEKYVTKALSYLEQLNNTVAANGEIISSLHKSIPSSSAEKDKTQVTPLANQDQEKRLHGNLQKSTTKNKVHTVTPVDTLLASTSAHLSQVNQVGTSDVVSHVVNNVVHNYVNKLNDSSETQDIYHDKCGNQWSQGNSVHKNSATGSSESNVEKIAVARKALGSAVSSSSDLPLEDKQKPQTINTPVGKKQRFLKTHEALKNCGLMEVTMKTAHLINQQQIIDSEIEQLKSMTATFLNSIGK